MLSFAGISFLSPWILAALLATAFAFGPQLFSARLALKTSSFYYYFLSLSAVLPILTFTAPKAGRYVVRLKSAEASVWGLHGMIALNVVHFPAGQPKGKSLAFHRTQRGALEPANIEFEVQLSAGDDIAFEIDTSATGGGGGAVYRETDITIGWFGE